METVYRRDAEQLEMLNIGPTADVLFRMARKDPGTKSS